MTLRETADHLTDSGLPPDLASRLQAALEAYHVAGATLATSDSGTDKLFAKLSAFNALKTFVFCLGTDLKDSAAKRVPHTVMFSGEVTAVPRATGEDVFVAHCGDCDGFSAFACEEGESFADIGIRFLTERNDGDEVYDLSDDDLEIRDKEGGPIYRMSFVTHVDITYALCAVEGPMDDPDDTGSAAGAKALGGK